MVTLLLVSSLVAANPVPRVEVALGLEGEKPRVVKVAPGAKIAPEPGEDVLEYRLVLAKGVDPATVKLEARIVSSVSVGAEGPHWDLVGWRDGVSEWTQMQRVDPKRLAFKLVVGEVPTTKPYTRDELNAELKRVDQGAPQAGDDGVTVNSGVSRYEVRVMVKEGAEWKPALTFSVHPPMGC